MVIRMVLLDGCVDGYIVGCGGWLLGWLCGQLCGVVVWMVVGLAVWDGCGQLNILSDKIGRHPAPLGMLLAFSSLLGPFVAPLLF